MKIKLRIVHHVAFVVLLLILTGCASGVLKDDWTESLIGKSGYVREPVKIVHDEKKKWEQFSDFRRCSVVEIVEARKYGKNTGLVVRQEGKLFYLWSADNFINEFSNTTTDAKLAEYLAPTLEDALGPKTTVKLASGTSDSHTLQCQSTYWAGMTVQQLVFVKGRPELANKTESGQEWVYTQDQRKQIFDIANGKLVRWQD